MKKKWSILLVFFLFFLLFLFIKKPFLGKRGTFTLETVKRGQLVNKISASGVVNAENQIDLKFQTSGNLVWVGVKEGDFVNQWQAIAQLDTRELFRNLEKALRDYSSERWDLDEARQDYDITADNLDKYTLTHEVRRVLEKNQFDLEKAVLDVELKDIALKYATLITPISGIITHIDTPIAGVNITPATAVFTVSDPQSVYFSANIDETDISKVRLNQKAKVILDSFEGDEFNSQISNISFTSIKTSGGGTAFPVKVALPLNPDLKFKPGMNGDLEIILEEKEGVLYVSASAVMEKGERRFVWLVEKTGRAQKKEIKIGLETEEEIEVLEGLLEGDKIITKDVSKIKEGQKIE